MTAQNIYDDQDFLAGYEKLDRQVRGLDGAAEWPTLRSMLPDVAGRRVGDLGCGFGWFSRWADQNGATHVISIDASTKMLEEARNETTSPTIEYRCEDLDALDLAPDSIDVAFSSLTLHYLQDIDRFFSMVARAICPGGSIVFSVEHPIFSAPTTQDFEVMSNGDRIWPLDNYPVEGPRVRNWFVDGVVKEHRSVATYVNAVKSGLASHSIASSNGVQRLKRSQHIPKGPTIDTDPGFS